MLRVKDVASVGIGSGVRTGSATLDGNEAVLGSALMLIGENSRLVSGRVHQRLEELRKKLPPGMELETLYNRTELRIPRSRRSKKISSKERSSLSRFSLECWATGGGADRRHGDSAFHAFCDDGNGSL